MRNLFGNKKKGSIQPPSPAANFTASDSLLDEDLFWQIIKTSKDNAQGNFELQQNELVKMLRTKSPDDIILFANRFRYFRGKANTWELWGAIYIIHGGCSDDSFNDFREWVIGQGKEFYYRTVTDPESLVGVETSKIEDVDWEGLGYVPASCFPRNNR